MLHQPGARMVLSYLEAQSAEDRGDASLTGHCDGLYCRASGAAVSDGLHDCILDWGSGDLVLNEWYKMYQTLSES